MMDIYCGTTYPLPEGEPEPIKWSWDSLESLIVGSTKSDEIVCQFEYEDLVGLASLFEKIKAERLKEKATS